MVRPLRGRDWRRGISYSTSGSSRWKPVSASVVAEEDGPAAGELDGVDGPGDGAVDGRVDGAAASPVRGVAALGSLADG